MIKGRVDKDPYAFIRPHRGLHNYENVFGKKQDEFLSGFEKGRQDNQ